MNSYQKVLVISESVAVETCGRGVIGVSANCSAESHVGVVATSVNCFLGRRLIEPVLACPLSDWRRL